jgi:solute carrier family 30 (zinc transporter), member 1
MIASVHIQVNLPKLSRIKKYHSIARAIRTCLHAYGIHSSTIQPEFADKPAPATDGREAIEVLDAEEDTPLLEADSQRGCLFECVGGGECADNRCCDDGDLQTTKGKKNGTGYGTGGGNRDH